MLRCLLALLRITIAPVDFNQCSGTRNATNENYLHRRKRCRRRKYLGFPCIGTRHCDTEECSEADGDIYATPGSFYRIEDDNSNDGQDRCDSCYNELVEPSKCQVVVFQYAGLEVGDSATLDVMQVLVSARR